MPIYSASNHIVQQVREVIAAIAEKHHKDFHEQGVTVDVLAAYAEGSEPAVSLHGRPCYATIKIVPYKDRVLGRKDVELKVDGDAWEHMSPARREALVSHELEHIIVKLADPQIEQQPDGTYKQLPPKAKLDDAGRPKLKIRDHDWEIGGFKIIVERFGADSIEAMQCRQMLRSVPVRQMCLPFMNEPPETEDDYVSSVVEAAARDPNANGVVLSADPSTMDSFSREVGQAFADAGLTVVSAADGEVVFSPAKESKRRIVTNRPGVTKRKAAAAGSGSRKKPR